MRCSLHLMCVALAIATILGSCSSPTDRTRPSILLFVFDTTRADAVSASGRVRNTTPELDELAASGLWYTHAYANAPWTLPSHATLFSGLLVNQHGVGSRQLRAPDELVMLAERLRAMGYETVGFSENPFVSETFNLTQGFEQFSNKGAGQTVADVRHPEPGQFNVRELVANWLHDRESHLPIFARQRPFFLFVNVMDAHAPYDIRPENPFVPPGVDAGAVRAVHRHVNQRICARLPPPEEIEILKGLYLGGVLAADAKLRAIRTVLREAGAAEDLVTVVTSDHGELFGERRLMEHQFSVHESLLRVPLVVVGLPGTKPTAIAEPVQLADIVPSVLHWVGAEIPADLPGRPLPTEAAMDFTARSFVAEFTDNVKMPLPDNAPAWLKDGQEQARTVRSTCTAEDRVFGNMLALVRYPYKLIWYERYPVELYDLESDPDERSDLVTLRPDVVAVVRHELGALLAHPPIISASGSEAALPEDVQEQLRALGYLGGSPGRPLSPPAAPR